MNNLYIVTRYNPDGFLAGTEPTNWMLNLQYSILANAGIDDECIEWHGGVLNLGHYIDLYWKPKPDDKEPYIVYSQLISMLSSKGWPITISSMADLGMIRFSTRAYFRAKHSWLREVNPEKEILKSSMLQFGMYPPQETPPQTEFTVNLTAKDVSVDQINEMLKEMGIPTPASVSYDEWTNYLEQTFKALEKVNKKPHVDQGMWNTPMHGGSNLSALSGGIDYSQLLMNQKDFDFLKGNIGPDKPELQPKFVDLENPYPATQVDNYSKPAKKTITAELLFAPNNYKFEIHDGYIVDTTEIAPKFPEITIYDQLNDPPKQDSDGFTLGDDTHAAGPNHNPVSGPCNDESGC